MPDLLWFGLWAVLSIASLIWHSVEKKRKLKRAESLLSDLEVNGKGRERL